MCIDKNTPQLIYNNSKFTRKSTREKFVLTKTLEH